MRTLPAHAQRLRREGARLVCDLDQAGLTIREVREALALYRDCTAASMVTVLRVYAGRALAAGQAELATAIYGAMKLATGQEGSK